MGVGINVGVNVQASAIASILGLNIESLYLAIGGDSLANRAGDLDVEYASWALEGNTLSTDNHAYVVPQTDTQIALFNKVTNTLTRQEWDGTDWAQIGNALTVDFQNADTMIKLTSTRVVWIKHASDDLLVYEWDGTDWAQIGATYDFGDTSGYANGDYLEDNSIAVWSGNSVASPHIQKLTFDGTTFTKVGNTLSKTGIYQMVVGLRSDRIANIDIFNDEIITYDFDGTNWNQVGNAFSFTASNGVLGGCRLSGNQLMYWSVNNLQAASFDGTDWVNQGASIAIGASSNPRSMAALGTDKVAAQYYGGGGNLKVVKATINSAGLALVDHLEQFYGAGNVLLENFSQGGLRTYKTIDDNASAGGVYFWDDTTSLPSAKLTSLLTNITTPADVNGVVLFLGSNDKTEDLEADYIAGTINDTQYITALTELCAYLKDTAFPSAEFILLQRFHRYETTNFPSPRLIEAIKRNQQAVIDNVSYVHSLPDIWETDLEDATHPSQSAYEDVINPRMGDVIAQLHGKTTNKSLVGPKITSAVLNADHVIATIEHDQGTDITVPTDASFGFRYNLSDDEATGDNATGDVTKIDTTTIKIDLPDINVGTGTTEKLYTTYGRTNALSQTDAEAIVDNTTIPCPLRQGPVIVVESDLVRQLTNLELDMNARASSKTLSGSDVTNVGGLIEFESTSGRYPEYDDTAFGGAGALVAPDAATHMKSSSDFATEDTCMIGIVFETPVSNSANLTFFSTGESGFGDTGCSLLLTSTGELDFGRNQGNGYEELDGSAFGKKFIVILNYKGVDDLDIYINSTTPNNVDPKDGFNTRERIWLFGRTTSVDSPVDLKIARVFKKDGAHDAVNDPSIADLMGYLNTQYNVGLTL